jgi:hypothetical protein
MKYFAKYIPIEGKIKEGDYIKDESGIHHVTAKGSKVQYDAINKANHIQKVKLFLCSRDIQVGDRVHGTILKGNNVYVSDKEDGYSLKDDIHRISLEEAQIMDAYKVIGEISPDALWVKEGDEFIKDQLMWRVKDHLSGYEIDEIDFRESLVPEEEDYIIIKCPCCGTYK